MPPPTGSPIFWHVSPVADYYVEVLRWRAVRELTPPTLMVWGYIPGERSWSHTVNSSSVPGHTQQRRPCTYYFMRIYTYTRVLLRSSSTVCLCAGDKYKSRGECHRPRKSQRRRHRGISSIVSATPRDGPCAGGIGAHYAAYMIITVKCIVWIMELIY